ncbi:DNA binding protein [Sulfitobacter phage pCB2047-C]|uniref:DNA binding protein n=1 Tax=Sulfitobacter phage pCB2047-C TaxID=754043 RepID=UPI0002C135C5|nr:DNA binding protein [Sulfitobacter phage pCB2047-C]AGG91222.1 DNA binding protein [Sulfitobacter phage pCB2047-C]
MTTTSQSTQILAALKAGQHITPIDALNRFGCLRLGARVYDLKHAGHKIHTARVETPSGAFVASYSMEVQA